MPSLVIDARMVHSSGIGVYLRQLIPLVAAHFQITLLGKVEEFTELREQAEFSVIPDASPIYSLKEQRALFSKVPACDIFWSPQYNVPLFPIRAKRRVVTIHDAYHLAFWHTLTLAQKVYAPVVMRAATKLSDQVVTVSNFSRQEIIHHTKCSPDKVKVIYNGLDHTLFRPSFSENARETLQRAMPHLPEKYLLYVGNVKPHKNLITLLRAYAKLSPEVRETYGLVLVGKKEGFLTPDQEVFSFLEQEPGLAQRVHFTGYVPDPLLPFLYNCASLSVFPSLYEGFGLPPLESMACGCPVLASNAASIPEVCGQAAMYFNPLHPEELTSQIELVLREERLQQELRQKGFEQSQKFSWESSAHQHIQLFHTLAAFA
ncbi:glycosyltransferase family 4 protein [Rufibacter glacialis]|uniref:Glycosyltransferase family 4 protein n=1 Tax=Rufibacter glacialis TaxID=1259555 RepID=A0A5M8QHZ5_9BACT|nr:glycosyltransferase family 1 protein [Rufibacter glacialis]KAA6434594.1 glycosyltransferase family 4 protein [Rufibacter glacialis]GGK70829.1 glycosyl transferase [Rufibacter glacialis]